MYKSSPLSTLPLVIPEYIWIVILFILISEIKEEPIELDSNPPSPRVLTPTDFIPIKDETVTPSSQPFTQRNTKIRPKQTVKNQANKAKQMAAKPVGIIRQINVNDLQSKASIAAIQKVLKQSPKSPKIAPNMAARKGKTSKAKGKTAAAKKIKLNFKSKSEPAAKKMPLPTASQSPTTNNAEESQETDAKAEDELESRLNGPLIATLADFKTSEEILAMFPEEVINPKRKKTHWKDKCKLYSYWSFPRITMWSFYNVFALDFVHFQRSNTEWKGAQIHVTYVSYKTLRLTYYL